MQHLDEGTIHAWLDGALTVEESARAEAHVTSCAKCADAVAEARGLIAASTRILTALDNVPNVRIAKGAKGARGAERPFLVTWLVRERLAAVVALVVAAGALAVVMSRPSEQFALLDTAIVPVAADEVLVRDTIPTSLGAQKAEQQQEVSARRVAPGRGAVQSGPRQQDFSATRNAEAVPSMRVEMPQVTVAQAPPPSLPTDDSVRGAVGAAAAAAPKAGQTFSAEGRSSVAERIARVMPRQRDAAEAVEPFAAPRPQISVRGAKSIATQPAPSVTLLQEEQMKEGERDVRRRIYRVDDLLVTLDERVPLELEERRPALSANVVADSVGVSVNTIRWIDTRGMELSLTGAATKERLEQIRKVLGY